MAIKASILGSYYGPGCTLEKPPLTSLSDTILACSAQYLLIIARRVYWGDEIAQGPPVVDYDAVMQSDEAVKSWISLIVSRLSIPSPEILLTSS